MFYETNQGMGISELTGMDQAVLYGSFDLSVSYTLMIDFGYDVPSFSQFIANGNYTYVVYNSGNNVPQIMIKYKTDFFADLTYNDTSSNSSWNFGYFFIAYWNAHYSNGELPIVKYFKAFPFSIEALMTSHYTQLTDIIEDKFIVFWSARWTTSHYLLFDKETLEFTKSYSLTFSLLWPFSIFFSNSNKIVSIALFEVKS